MAALPCAALTLCAPGGGGAALAASVVQAPSDAALRNALEVKNFVSKEVAFRVPEGWVDDNKRILAALAEQERVASDRYAQRLRDGPKLLSPQEISGSAEVEESEEAQRYKAAAKTSKSVASPFVARFMAPSEDGSAVSVATKPAQDMRLVLFTVKSMADLGEPGDKEVASLFVPPDAKLVAAPTADELSGRLAYRYEFTARGRHVLLTAIARRGDIWVMAATADEARWGDYEDELRATTRSFKVLRTKYG